MPCSISLDYRLAPVTKLAAILGDIEDADLRYWLENMVWRHRFTPAEVRAATGCH